MNEILEKERICPFCSRKFNRGPKGYLEYKFCPECYEERLLHVNAKTVHNSIVTIIDFGNGYIDLCFN